MSPVKYPRAPPEFKLVVLAEDQPEYEPLPCAISPGNERIVTEWTFTDAERAAIANGGNLRLTQLVFNRPFQPVLVEVLAP